MTDGDGGVDGWKEELAVEMDGLELLFGRTGTSRGYTSKKIIQVVRLITRIEVESEKVSWSKR